MFNLREEIQLHRPNITESTMKTYLANLKKMNSGNDIDNLEFLNNIEFVSSVFSNFKIPTQRNYITSVLVALSIYDKTEKWNDWKELYENYKKRLEELTSDYQKEMESHSKSQKQEDGWITREQQLKLMNYYKRELKSIGFDYEKPSSKGMKYLQYLVIIGLYYYHCPRRLEYAPMYIINRRELNDGKRNFLLVLSKTNKYFIFNQFKTVKKVGKQEIKVDKKLNLIINNWIKARGGELNEKPFLLNSKGDALSSNGLGKLIKTAFYPSGNENVSVNILRHVYTSEIIGVEEIEKQKLREKVAHEMAHTTKQQLEYIKI